MVEAEIQIEGPGDTASARLRRRGAAPASLPVSFLFDGKPIAALAGETIAAALAANRVVAVRRLEMAEPDRPAEWRGLYCGMGACFDCVVTVDGRAGQRACLTKVEGGEDVCSAMPMEAAAESLRPLARPPDKARLESQPVDVLVIGGGPAGLAAAVAARNCGAGVVVLDERPESGGQYYKPVASSHRVSRPPDQQFAEGARLVAAARVAGVKIIQGAVVWGALTPVEVVALVDGQARLYAPRRLILATGAYERATPIPGWTLPGVMTTGAVQTLARAYQVAPGARVLVAGNGPLNFQVAADLATHGVTVAAVVESAAKPRLGPTLRCLRAGPKKMAEGARYLRTLSRRGVQVLWSHAVVAAEGRERAELARIAPVTPDGTILADQAITIEADIICLGYGFISSSEAANALGCRMRLDPRHLGSLAVETSETGETSIEGVLAVGDGARVAGADVALARGAIAGATAARQLGFAEDADRAIGDAWPKLQRAEAFQEALWSLFDAPPVRLDQVPDETILCRCESLNFGRIRTAVDHGARSLAVLKRRTRLGMGRCQGRYCAPVAARLLREAGHETPGGFAPRLPLKPFPAGALAFEKPEWGGHRRAGSPNLARAVTAEPFGRDVADTVVIGSGVVGACLAYELAQAGIDVLVVERDDTNLQASGANAGSLHVQLLSFDFGGKAEMGGAPAAATLPLGPWAVAIWRELAEACARDFEIRITGGLMVAETDAGMDFLRQKAAVEQRHGLEAEIIGQSELRRLAPNLAETLIGAEYSPLEGKINPLTATYSVLEAARALGARFHRSTDVGQVERSGGKWRLHSNRGVIEAGRIVNAAGPWHAVSAPWSGWTFPCTARLCR